MPELHLLERAQSALPHEQVLGAIAVQVGPQSGGRTPVPPDEYRAVIFEGHRMPGDAWGAFWGTVGGLFTGGNRMNDPPSPSLARHPDREKARRWGQPYYGEWTSAAGRLLAAVQPRSKAGVYPVLAVTEHRLHVVCIQRKRGSFATLGTLTHVTCSLDRQDLGWVRERGQIDTEFGFRDGSWATLKAPVVDVHTVFPDVLAKKSPIPW